ncbi:YqaJ viral recombinase family protein [Candidatus Pacearchaeota archaeon]|nr:YqaJ viral recombinase family protein [Candidatus Pacearchaeota archaeon]
MIIQGTDEWFAIRLGKVTASRICDVLADKKTAAYQNYKAELICERLTGIPTEHFVSYDMQRGTDLEPVARDAYLFVSDAGGYQEGFVSHHTIKMAGMSPDLLIGKDGMAEIKVPKPAKHIKLLTGSKIESKWIKQMQFQLGCSGRQWNDFISYCPEVGTDYQLFVQRVNRDEELIAEMEKAVVAFLAEVEATIKQLTN